MASAERAVALRRQPEQLQHGPGHEFRGRTLRVCPSVHGNVGHGEGTAQEDNEAPAQSEGAPVSAGHAETEPAGQAYQLQAAQASRSQVQEGAVGCT